MRYNSNYVGVICVALVELPQCLKLKLKLVPQMSLVELLELL